MSVAICAICYEDAKPLAEDLQSISACGHVFHELCLQQWMEYCPAGKRATCPLCKQSCTDRDVHRLYFQSAENDSTQGQASSSKSSQSDVEDSKQVNNAPALRKLELQLAAVKTALQTRNEQSKELDSQVAANLQRAEKAEGAAAALKRELSQCRMALTRTQEELKCCSSEREMLKEKNQAMTKSLAAHKLVEDTDLCEEDIYKLANLGSGSNKIAIIETLTKSLILRNKSYKELMARCNELGMGENRALRKSEKTIESLKKMKARVQDLEKQLEEKDNSLLRGLNKGNLKSRNEEVSSRPPLNHAGAKGINEPSTPPSNQYATVSTGFSRRNIPSKERKVQENTFKLNEPRQVSYPPRSADDGFNACAEDLDIMPRAELSEVQLPNIVKERGLMGVEHVQPAHPTNVNTFEEKLTSRKRGHVDADTSKEDNTASTGFSYWIIKSRDLLQKIESLNKSKLPSDRKGTDRKYFLTMAPRENEDGIPNCKDQSVLSSPRGKRASNVPSCSESPEHVTSFVAPPVSTYGAFAKRAPSDRQSASSSTFIVSGADGRGGKVTVFKPPSISQGGIAVSTSQKAKKPKTSGGGFRGRQGSLQIEHFFGRAK